MALADALALADSRLSVWLPVIETAQGAYFLANGRYMQALSLAGRVPVADAGEALPVTGADTRPTDQAETWRDVAPLLPITTRIQVRIDTYESSEGAGYLVHACLIYEGTTYEKCINYGPLVGEAFPWRAAV